ncbi:MAG: hypothetical protein AB7N76_32230 [Planctomycetota bacterium]
MSDAALDDAAGAALIAAAEAALAGLALANPASERRALLELLPPLVAGREAAFLVWARHHLRWSLVVAEVAERACAKPREAALLVLLELVREGRPE